MSLNVRDFINVGKNAKEVRSILNSEKVMVDGKKRKEIRSGVGLFDVLSINGQNYRVVLDRKGRLVVRDVKKDESSFKLSKVLGKKAIGKGKFQVRTNDGRTILGIAKDISPGDTIKITVPKQEIKEHYKMEKGNTAIIISGKRIASVGKIVDVLEGTISREKIVKVVLGEGKEFQTVSENVFVVGKKSPIFEVSANDASAN